MISKQVDTVSFHTKDREQWIQTIVSKKASIKNNKEKGKYHIGLYLGERVSVNDFEPIHIVSLMCFIEHLHQIGYKVTLTSPNSDVNDYLYNTLKLREYYVGDGASHVESNDDTILNLWKVKPESSIAYSQSVTDYFNKKFFKGYDMSALKNALDEAYANIADHAKANDNAFSYISYDAEKQKIHIAICDFGLGIPNTLRNANSIYNSDSEALRDSLNIGVSARTNVRNRGFGLDNILATLSDDDNFRIVSNGSLLQCLGNKKNIKTLDLEFDFKGTLIYFEVSTSSFPEDNIEEEITIG